MIIPAGSPERFHRILAVNFSLRMPGATVFRVQMQQEYVSLKSLLITSLGKSSTAAWSASNILYMLLAAPEKTSTTSSVNS